LIDYYERRAPNPSLAFIQQAPMSWTVSVAEPLVSEIVRKKRAGGPVKRIRGKPFEQASQLSRGQQEKIDAFTGGFVSQHTNRRAQLERKAICSFAYLARAGTPAINLMRDPVGIPGPRA
jgi:hypothetical protein